MKRGPYTRDKDVNLYLRATTEDLNSWREQATQLGISLSEWIRRACRARRKSKRSATRRVKQPTADNHIGELP